MREKITINPKIDEKDLPLIGKTFSLYGDGLSSDKFYSEIKEIVDSVLPNFNDKVEMLSYLEKMGKRKWNIRINKTVNLNSEHHFRGIDINRLSKFTYPAKSHLANLTFFQRFDKTISTPEYRYHLYMLEIELVNRMNISGFKNADLKMAFLPHCLHDLEKNCLSEPDGVDYICKRCSKKCFIRAVTELLNEFDVKAYIWMTANLKSLFKKLKSENKKIGVLGIACVPELINGMRMVRKFNVPVIGVPLDANRCRRWFGEFHKTSVNLNKIYNLIKNKDK